MADLSGQTIASSYEQLLSLPDGGGNANTLVAVTDGDGGTTFGIKLATNKVEIIPGSNDTNAFEVSQADGTAVLTVNTSTAGATITGVLNVFGGGSDASTSANAYADNLVIRGSNDGNGSGITIFSEDDEFGTLYFGDGGSGADAYRGYVQYSHSANELQLGSDGSTRLVIDSSGKVGIGCTPNELLHVEGSSPSIRIKASNEGGLAELKLESDQGDDDADLWSLRADPAHEFKIMSNSTGSFSSHAVFRLTETEFAKDVGIGTNPSVKLHVKEDNSSDDAQIKVENDGTGDAGIAFLLTGTRGYSMGIDNSDGDKFIIGGDDNAIGTTPYITIDHSNSNVGIGCSDPEAKLQVNTGVSDATIAAINVGYGIEFNGGTGGHVGMAVIDGSSGRGKNRGFIGFRGDSASSMGKSHIVFGTAPGVADDPVEIMRITTTGKVGIGQDDPSAGKLEIRVSGDGERALQITNTDSNQTSSDETMRITLSGDTSPSNPRLIGFEDGDSQIGGIVATGGTTVEYSTSSDYRLKENEQLITDGLERVKKLKPYKFNWKTLPDKIVDGFFAHEVAEVVPEAVIGDKDATRIHDRTEREIVDPQLLNVSRLVPILVASIQELSEKVTELENKLGE